MVAKTTLWSDKSLKSKRFLYVCLLFSIPLVSSVTIVALYQLEIQEKRGEMTRAVQKQTAHLISESLERIERSAQSIINTEGLAEYCYAQPDVRLHLENRIVGRIEASLPPNIACWKVEDSNKKPIITIKKTSCQTEDLGQEGFTLTPDQNRIILKKRILVDDNYLPDENGNEVGSLVFEIETASFIREIPFLVSIQSLGDKTKEGDFSIHFLSSVGDFSPDWHKYLFLALMNMAIAIAASFFIYRDQKHQSMMGALERAAQMVAHDIRKPFSQLKSLAQLLMLQPNNPNLAKQFLPRIDASMDQVDRILRELLLSGKAKADINSSTEPLAALQRVVLAMPPTASVQLTIDMQHRQQVAMDAVTCERLLGNLLSNAIEAMGSKGKIWIKTRLVQKRDKAFVQFVVGNSNSQISKKDLGNIFSPFFTLKKNGTGLGLAICKKIVESSGGTIRCESNPELGVEMCFSVLASAQASETTKLEVTSDWNEYCAELRGAKPQQIEISNAGPKVRVVVIDDDPLYIQVLNDQIAFSDLRDRVHFHAFMDPALALSIAESLNPDLVIVDVDFGSSIDGFSLVAELKKSLPNAIFCVHSNRAESTYSQTALDSGASFFIPKPMTIAQLANLITSSKTV